MVARSLALVGMLVFALVGVGCTASVRPTVSESEFIGNEAKCAANVALVCTDSFRNYVSDQGDPGDMRNWKMELGPASADAFRYHLQADFDKVDIIATQPTFPAKPEIKAVLVPSITGVKTTMPVMFKFEQYTVTMTFAVDVFDSAGKKAYSRTYVGYGKQQGSVGYESGGHAALPVASRLAIRQAIDAAVHDLVAYVKSGTVPQVLANNQ